MKKLLAASIIALVSTGAMATQSLDLSDVYDATGQSVPSDVQTNIDDFISTADGNVTTSTAQVYSISISGGILSKSTEDFDYTEGGYSTEDEFNTAKDTLLDSVVTDFLGGADRELSVLDNKITVTEGERNIDADYGMLGRNALGTIGSKLGDVIDDLNSVNDAAVAIVDLGFTSDRWSTFDNAATAFTTEFDEYNDLVTAYSSAITDIDDIDHITE